MSLEKLGGRRVVVWGVVFAVVVGVILLADLLIGPEADHLHGVAWIVFTLVVLAVVYAVYFAAPASDAWKVGRREVIYMVVGALLYGFLSWLFGRLDVGIPAVSRVSLRPAVAIPVFFGFVFGPVVGFFTGAVGNALGDFLSGWGVYPTWDVGNGIMGLVPGLVWLYPAHTGMKKKGLNILTYVLGVLIALIAAIILLNPRLSVPWAAEVEDFSFWGWAFIVSGVVIIAGRYVLEEINLDMASINIWGTLGIIIGIGAAAASDVWVNDYNFMTAIIGEFAPAAGPNILNSMIISPLLLLAYEAFGRR